MFIDISTYVGHWPFRSLKNNTLEELDRLAQRHNITHMVVANLNGLFYKDASEANEELLNALQTYCGKTVFLPMAMVDPTYPHWDTDAVKMIDRGFAGFELAPLYHGYTLRGAIAPESYCLYRPADAAMELAASLNVPVRICAKFEDSRGRGRRDIFEDLTGDDYCSLLRTQPDVHVFCTELVPCEIGNAFAELLKTRVNTYFDAAEGDCQTGFPERNLKTVSMNQICYGSMSPFRYMEASLINMAYGSYDENAMMTNAARAFKALR